MNRRSLLLTALTLAPPLVAGSCEFCLSGLAPGYLAKELETIPDSLDPEGRTCADVASLAAALESTSPDFDSACLQLMLAEVFCCPNVVPDVSEEDGGIFGDLLGGGDGGLFAGDDGGFSGEFGAQVACGLDSECPPFMFCNYDDGQEDGGFCEDCPFFESCGDLGLITDFGVVDCQSSCQESSNSTDDGLFGLDDFFGSSSGTGSPCAACPEGLPEGAADTVVSFEGEDSTCAEMVDGASFLEDGTDFCSLFKAPVESVCCPDQIEEVADPCLICPNGITEGEDTATDDGSTCSEIESASSMISAGGMLCDSYKLAAYACCPADAPSDSSWLEGFDDGFITEVENPCTPCPNGAANESAIVLPPGTDADMAMSCADQLAQAAIFEEGSDMCMYMRPLAQISCCPEEANPCEICPSGVSDGAVIPGDEEEGDMICSEVVEYGMFMDANSESCEMSKYAQAYCCPDDIQAVENPCSFCPGGVSVDSSSLISDDAEDLSWCDTYVAFAKTMDKSDEMCSDMQMGQYMCCPDDAQADLGLEAADPCPVCPGGVSVDANTIVPDTGGFTCEMGLAYAKTVNKSDEECSDIIQMGQYICCPDDVVQVADPCPVCPGGVSADANTIIPDSDGTSCEIGLAYAKTVDKSDKMCSEIQMAQYICCPDDVVQAADPCPFCPGGVSVDANTIIPDADGLSCELGNTYAKTVDKSDEMCSEIQMAQYICCPDQVKVDDPCQFCTGGLAVEESTPVIGAPNEETCGDLLGFAAVVEDGDAVCSQMKLAEGQCCPGGSGAEEVPAEQVEEVTVEEATADAPTDGAVSEAGGTAPETPSETDTADEEADASSTGDSTEASTGDAVDATEATDPAVEETETTDPAEEPGIDPVEDGPSVEPPTGSAFDRAQLFGSCVMAISIAFLL